PVAVNTKAQTEMVGIIADGHGLIELGPCVDAGESWDGKKLAVVGRIASVRPRQIEVSPESNTRNQVPAVTVDLSEATRICTVYGGYVSAEELAVGQRLGVWLDSHSVKQPLQAVALVLASTDPNDDWP